jgi:hypothetical protein
MCIANRARGRAGSLYTLSKMPLLLSNQIVKDRPLVHMLPSSVSGADFQSAIEPYGRRKVCPTMLCQWTEADQALRISVLDSSCLRRPLATRGGLSADELCPFGGIAKYNGTNGPCQTRAR